MSQRASGSRSATQVADPAYGSDQGVLVPIATEAEELVRPGSVGNHTDAGRFGRYGEHADQVSDKMQHPSEVSFTVSARRIDDESKVQSGSTDYKERRTEITND